jgi:heat shock 70kDa protein 4
MAMYLGKLRDIAANELKTGVCDVVISVPGWFTDIQRRAVLDAATIANLNALRLINDTTAVALGYGITKSDLPEAANPRHVVFIDMGHSNFSVAVIAFSKGQLTVRSTAYDRHLGGRDIDYALVQHFAEEFKSKYRIDVLSNLKATLRLSVACEKLKKVLSANIEAPLNVESIMNDVDASSKLHRDNFEALIAHVVNRIPHVINEAIANSGLTLDQIDSIELVGGSTRVPIVRTRIQSAFPGKPLSTTLNQDEAVARGATFSCAMLSPTFRVREFHVYDINYCSIKAHWEQNPVEPSEDTELILFPRGNGIPSTKVLTFYRKEPFDVEASYAEPGALPGGINPWIARITAKAVTLDGKETTDTSIVKVKTRLNAHGILSFESAYVEEIEEKEEQPMEIDGETPQVPKKKKVTKKRELPFVTSSSSYDSTTLERLKEKEAEMNASDKLVMDTEVHLSLFLFQ